MRASRLLIALYLGIASPCFAQETTWTQRFTAQSPPAVSGFMAYDSARQQVVLFTGADTWIWDGNAWTQKFPVTSPPGRTNTQIVYDSARSEVVLFGGGNLSDTWTWDGTNWTQRFPATSPPPRAGAGAAYDALHQQFVLFGGVQNGPVFLGDTWVWDGSNWTQKFPAHSPSVRNNPAMAYDLSRQQVVFFSGSACVGCIANDTWVWDGTDWTQKFPSTSPPVRFGSAMAYDPAGQQLLLFGGFGSPCVGGGCFGNLDDTWTWDGTNWTQKFPAANPAGRGNHGMASDSARLQVVLFGGSTNPPTTQFNDTWVWGSAITPAYVVNSGSGSVSVINTTANTVITTVQVGSVPQQVAITPDGTRAYVTNACGSSAPPSSGGCGFDNGSVSVINTSTNTVTATVQVGFNPIGVAITPDGAHAYVVNQCGSLSACGSGANGSVSVIDTSNNTVTATIQVGFFPVGVAITPDGAHAYVTNTCSSSSTCPGGLVSVVDTSTNRVTATVSVGFFPDGVAITPDGTHAYVVNDNLGSVGSVSVIDTSNNTVTATIQVGVEPIGVAITPNGAHAYVVNHCGSSALTCNGTVSVIDTSTNTVTTSVSVGSLPQQIAITPDGTHAYVTNEGSPPGTVSVIDTSTNMVTAVIQVGLNPIGVAVANLVAIAPSITLNVACVNGLQVDINGAATPGASVTSISWNWGDGTTTTGFFPQSHTYSSQGQYTVQVTAHYSNGSSSSASQGVNVAPAILSNCLALTILAGQYGSVSYQASVGSSVVPPGTSVVLHLDFADDLNLTANANNGFAFSIWSASPNITGTNGNPINANSPSIVIVAGGSGTIGAIFTVSAQSYQPIPTTVTLSANPASVVELPNSLAAITATVLDQSGNVLPGINVTFATSIGLLSEVTQVTNSNGQATVMLSPNLNSISPVVAMVTGTAGTVQSSTSVTFLPSGSIATSWTASPAFNIQQVTINLNQFLSTPTNLYDDCIRFFLCVGTPINLNQLTSPATVYFIQPPQGSSAQFAAALSQFFGIGQCTQSTQLNCIPSGYNPAAVIILQLPVIQVSNVLFNANLSSPLSLCLPIVAAALFSNNCIQSTNSGYVNVALTVSMNSNNNQKIQDLLSSIANTLSSFYKSSPEATLSTLEAYLQEILDFGDLTTSVITTDLNQTGPLNTYTLLDLDILKQAIINGFQADAITGKFFTILEAGTKVGSSLGTNLLADTQLIMTTLDLGIELLPNVIPSLNSNQLFQWFQTGLNVITTFVDPSGASILPSFADSSGSVVLGYNPANGEFTYASSVGILFPTGNGYLALLSENATAPSNYSETLNGVGSSTPVPYSTQVRSYNRGQVVQAYNGMLFGGTSVAIPIQFESSTGALIPQVHLAPIVTVQENNSTITIIAKAMLSDGSPATATDAFLILNGQESTMTQVNASTFEISINNDFTAPEPLIVYMISPNVPGGFATAVLAVVPPPSGNSCNGVYGGTLNGNLTVSTGQSCTLIAGRITGNVMQTGGSLVLVNTSVNGKLQVNGGGTFIIGASTAIQGDLQIHHSPSVSFPNDICGAAIGGNLQFQNNEAPVNVGTGSLFCPGSAIGGNLLVMNNTAATQIFHNTVGGNAEVKNNAAPVEIFDNKIVNNLQCEANSSITGGGNTAKKKQGQCAGF